MLQNSSIYNPIGADAPLGKVRSSPWPAWLRRPRMVVPRHLCTYHRIPCEGVPFFKLQDFANLQAQQHAPFVHFGVSAIKQGSQLHLWIWDKKHEDHFAQKHGKPERFQTIVQSLLTRRIASGVMWMPHDAGSSKGREAQLWKNYKLQDSQWFDAPPSQEIWERRLAQYSELTQTGWPLQLPPPARQGVVSERSFAINLTPRKHTSPPMRWRQWFNTLLVFSLAGVAGWAAWLQGQIQGYQEQMTANQAYKEQKISQDQPQQTARAATYNTLRRIKSIQGLSADNKVGDSLAEITQLFSRQGLWVRDIDINGQTIDATLIAPPGVTPRLTAILGVIESSLMFYDARFTDVVPGGGFRFAWRIQKNANQEDTPDPVPPTLQEKVQP